MQLVFTKCKTYKVNVLKGFKSFKILNHSNILAYSVRIFSRVLMTHLQLAYGVVLNLSALIVQRHFEEQTTSDFDLLDYDGLQSNLRAITRIVWSS